MTTTIDEALPADTDSADGLTAQETASGQRRPELAWLAWTVFAVAAGLAAFAFGAFVLGGAQKPGTGWGSGTAVGLLLSLLPVLAAMAVGAFLAARMPSNGIGWLFLFAALVGSVTEASSQYAHYGTVHLGSFPDPTSPHG